MQGYENAILKNEKLFFSNDQLQIVFLSKITTVRLETCSTRAEACCTHMCFHIDLRGKIKFLIFDINDTPQWRNQQFSTTTSAYKNNYVLSAFHINIPALATPLPTVHQTLLKYVA